MIFCSMVFATNTRMNTNKTMSNNGVQSLIRSSSTIARHVGNLTLFSLRSQNVGLALRAKSDGRSPRRGCELALNGELPCGKDWPRHKMLKMNTLKNRR